MKAVSIDADNLPEAVALLAKGFPKRKAAFWNAALARIARLHGDKGYGPAGTLLMKDGAAVGILLTIASDDPQDAGGRIVNLSSWYVEPQYRWFAPRMLQKAVSDPAAAYSDISPSRQAFALNEKLGFRLLTDSLALLALPFTALAAPSPARVRPLSAVPRDALAPQLAARMRDHAALGAICAVLDTGDGLYHPLIFAAARTRALPLARLIYAENRSLVLAHAGAVATFLLARGKLFLTMPVRRMERTPGGFMHRKYAPIQVKGAWNDDTLNLTYSEMVLLRR